MGPIMPPMESKMETNQPTALVQVGPKSHKSKIKQHKVVDLSTRLEFLIDFQNRDEIEVFLLTKNYSESSNGRSEGLNLVVKVSKRGLKNAKNCHKWAQ